MITVLYRIVIGDDTVAVRTRLREALCAQATFVEVLEASDAQQTIELNRWIQPAPAVLDLSMLREACWSGWKTLKVSVPQSCIRTVDIR